MATFTLATRRVGGWSPGASVQIRKAILGITPRINDIDMIDRAQIQPSNTPKTGSILTISQASRAMK